MRFINHLRILTLAIALALASVAVGQRPTEPKQLDEGFVSRSLVFEGGNEIIQIVFPAKYRIFEEDVVIFNEGAEHALKAYFGCAKFTKCQPKLVFDDGVTAEVGADTYQLSLLRVVSGDTYSKVIGINAVKIPKVVL